MNQNLKEVFGSNFSKQNFKKNKKVSFKKYPYNTVH